ncbi:microtubule-associated protein 6 homolog [Clarias gariepinus]|uniref:microtubule-associated protein 6 homolog n=1 Tax=Clarias gariepinus TaxID=13013 RepID=UPI00234C171E|nr:microtubule-associated protein 6 homolog [Clarias gariepinus]
MAWPCITRACCINRFWSELDKADIAVPLVFTKYSDVAEVRHLHPQPGPLAQSHHPSAVAIGTEPAHTAPQDAAAASASSAARGSSVTRQDFKPWRVKPEPSCKPKNEYRPCQTPFDNETQYRKDYKPWPIQKRGDHPWIPKAEIKSQKQEHVTLEPDTGVEKCEIEERVKEKDVSEEKKKRPVKKEEDAETGEKKKEQRASSKGRSEADALNRQIKQERTAGSSYRMEFKAYTDVKPVKPIKAKSQYKLTTEEKANLETSYSATFKGEQGKPEATDNKQLERRRIRSLYNEPSIKEPSKPEKPSVSHSKPKKTTSHSKTASKAKAKPNTGTQPAKKKSSVSKLELKPDGGVTKKSKEMINRLAEGKD